MHFTLCNTLLWLYHIFTLGRLESCITDTLTHYKLQAYQCHYSQFVTSGRGLCLYGPIIRRLIILTSNKAGGLKLSSVNVFDKFLCYLVEKV
jgi:hypothetical protein